MHIPDTIPHNPAWYGKMPSAKLKPLTAEWFRSMINNQTYHPDGSITRTLTPPSVKSSGALMAWLRVLAIVAFLVFLAYSATWAIWAGK